MLTRKFLPDCDNTTLCSIYTEVAKICKFVLVTTSETLAIAYREQPSTDSAETFSHSRFILEGIASLLENGGNRVSLFCFPNPECINL